MHYHNTQQVTFDSGVRSASDVFKALALGAKFVWIGRLWVWGLSIAGRAGVKHVMRALLAEFDILMNVSGYPKLEDINKDAIDSLPRVAIMPSDAQIT
jgi:isopentenyl diphosphate isomerase/L-lactate dehydrogenase-like FMN-dependent dehydrogenase